MRLIDTILQDAATAELSIDQYGHGKNYYSDLEGKAFPRIWIYDTFPVLKVGRNGSSLVEYTILGGVQQTVKFDAELSDLVNTFESVQAILTRYVLRIAKDSRIEDGIGDVKCEENWHLQANNVQELSFSFRLTIDEPITRPC